MLEAPLMVSATAAHRLAHPEAECAAARAAAAVGALMVYSSSATEGVTGRSLLTELAESRILWMC